MDIASDEARKPPHSLVYGIAILFLAVVLTGFIYRQRQMDAHNARVAAAQAKFDKYNHIEKAIEKAQVGYNKSANKFDAAERTSRRVSQKRHDDAISGSPDLNAELSWAKQEADAEQAAASDLESMSGYADVIHDAYANLYGANSVSQVRDAYSKFNTIESQYLDSWNRAITDIKDDLRLSLNGDSGDNNDSDIDHYYNEAQMYRDQAETPAAVVNLQWTTLNKRFASDYKSARAALQKAKTL